MFYFFWKHFEAWQSTFSEQKKNLYLCPAKESLYGFESTRGWVNDEAAFNKIRSAKLNWLNYILG